MLTHTTTPQTHAHNTLYTHCTTHPHNTTHTRTQPPFSRLFPSPFSSMAILSLLPPFGFGSSPLLRVRWRPGALPARLVLDLCHSFLGHFLWWAPFSPPAPALLGCYWPLVAPLCWYYSRFAPPGYLRLSGGFCGCSPHGFYLLSGLSSGASSSTPVLRLRLSLATPAVSLFFSPVLRFLIVYWCHFYADSCRFIPV